MGVTKSDLFTESQNRISQVMRALGHPARIAIIDHLIKANACINSDLVEEIGLSQPTISQHLQELKAIGIIHGNIEGVRVHYCIDSAKWGEIKEILQQWFDRYTGLGCC